MEMLDGFLGQLPADWQYGVEIRNKALLHPDYFAMLRRHGVAHVMNNWTHMPSVAEQWAMPGVLTAESFTAARFLLKPGRSYEQAVRMFSPYNATKEPYEEARRVAAEIADSRAKAAEARKTLPSFLFVNNRLEGNSLLTMLAVLMHLGLLDLPPVPAKQE